MRIKALDEESAAHQGAWTRRIESVEALPEEADDEEWVASSTSRSRAAVPAADAEDDDDDDQDVR